MASRRTTTTTTTRTASRRRQPVQVSGFDTHSVNGPRDPPAVSTPFRLTKTVPITLGLSSGAATFGWPNIVANTPACVTGTYNMRLVKLSVWASGSAPTVTTPVTPRQIILTDNTTDQMSFRDTGVPGQSLPQVHVTPAFALRQTWVSSSNTTALYNVSGDPTDQSCTVHATVEFSLI